FSGLYLVSLVVILVGFITFNAVPTPTIPTATSISSSSSSNCEEGFYENPGATENDVTREDAPVEIPIEVEEEDEEQQTDKTTRRASDLSRRLGEETDEDRIVECSTQM
ncbi:hypothetical protein ATANTOWER_024686, partial [Ataeniobius toweri]|nr:hypothetical protein [Ataeniobius toweri]